MKKRPVTAVLMVDILFKEQKKQGSNPGSSREGVWYDVIDLCHLTDY